MIKTYSIDQEITVRLAVVKPWKEEKPPLRLGLLFWFRTACISLVVAIELAGVGIWASSMINKLNYGIDQPTPAIYQCVHSSLVYSPQHQIEVSTDYSCH